MGDGGAFVKGNVQDQREIPYRGCRLDLLDAHDRRVLSSDVRVSGAFTASFVIAPYARSYLLRITCADSDETFTSEPTSLSGYPKPFDLGNVRLKRR